MEPSQLRQSKVLLFMFPNLSKFIDNTVITYPYQFIDKNSDDKIYNRQIDRLGSGKDEFHIQSVQRYLALDNNSKDALKSAIRGI